MVMIFMLYVILIFHMHFLRLVWSQELHIYFNAPHLQHSVCPLHRSLHGFTVCESVAYEASGGVVLQNVRFSCVAYVTCDANGWSLE